MLRPLIGLSVYRCRPPGQPHRQTHPARLSVYRFIGAGHPWALPVYRFIGLSARPPRQSDPMGFARLSVYRFIGAGHPASHTDKPTLDSARLSVYRFIGAGHVPLGPARLSVYRFIGLSARPPRQSDPMGVARLYRFIGLSAQATRPATPINPPWTPPVYRYLSVYPRRPPLGPARLSVYRFIGAAIPRQSDPMGFARLSVYRFIGLSAQATRPATPINPPWTPPVYRFIGLSAQANPGPCPFIGLSVGPARLSVYRRGHPVSQTPRPASQTSPLGLPRTSVYRRTHFVREELHIYTLDLLHSFNSFNFY